MFSMIGIFVTQFFNTAVILFLRGWWSQTERGISKHHEYGIDALNAQWYRNIGVILVGAMKFTALWPLIELFAFGMTFKLLRWADRSFSSDKYSTAQPSI